MIKAVWQDIVDTIRQYEDVIGEDVADDIIADISEVVYGLQEGKDAEE